MMRRFEEIEQDIRRTDDNVDLRVLQSLADELHVLQTPQATALRHHVMGTVARRSGDLPAALELFHRSLAACDEMGDRRGVARALINIGNLQWRTGESAVALAQYHRAHVSFEELGDRSGVAAAQHGIANVYLRLGDFPTSLEYFRRALAEHESLDDHAGISLVTGSIALVYGFTSEFSLAMEYYTRALEMHEEQGNQVAIASTTCNIGLLHAGMDEHESALDHFRRALVILEEINDAAGIALVSGNIIHTLIRLERFDEVAVLLERQAGLQMTDPVVRSQHSESLAALTDHHGDLDATHRHLTDALAIATQAGLRDRAATYHAHLRNLAQQRNDFAGYIEHNTEHQRIMEEIRGKEAMQRLATMEAERKVEGERRERDKERALLYGTLPKNIADRMIRGEKVSGDHYDDATVIFADIVGFTQISDSLPPGEVVQLLEQIFTAFDAICEKHGVTKIKTIGDSYMAVAFDSVVNAALCALEMSRFRISHEVSHNVSHNVSHEVSHNVSHEVSHNVSHEVSHNVSHSVSHAEGVLFVPHEVLFRIGMHCGPVTAGVIGTQRLQYDVWGDTVNVASRMESSGEAGRVQVSEAFASELKRNTEYTIQNSIAESGNPESHEVPLVTRHSSLVTTFRGMIDIKGKGPMRTYWLERSDR